MEIIEPENRPRFVSRIRLTGIVTGPTDVIIVLLLVTARQYRLSPRSFEYFSPQWILTSSVSIAVSTCSNFFRNRSA